MAIFIDTSYILALVNTADDYHEQASSIITELKGHFVTTEAILIEIGNSLAKLRWRNIAVSTLEDIRNDPDIEIISINSDLFDRAIKFYSSRKDKEWGITDCLSFIVMKDRQIANALTTDEHFQQAGFIAMLL